MEERLTLTEDRVSRIISMQRNSLNNAGKDNSFAKSNNENVSNQA